MGYNWKAQKVIAYLLKYRELWSSFLTCSMSFYYSGRELYKLVWFFEIGSNCVDQAGLELTTYSPGVILLPQEHTMMLALCCFVFVLIFF